MFSHFFPACWGQCGRGSAGVVRGVLGGLALRENAGVQAIRAILVFGRKNRVWALAHWANGITV